ncbi:hypothetical protein JKF63_01997 [Porcisia hertigi]|uniref:Uncharacterized protein n=1 Tax=Porcisia hertigi TaxID=2761500 RepID=A0A836HX85_9TRYP|nr:hypothetical protein JKF63_01997 [Porcisia hertigi]
MHSAELMRILFRGRKAEIEAAAKDKSFLTLCNQPLPNGQYPIHALVVGKCAEAAEVLLQAGVNANAESQEPGDTLGFTAAHYAAIVDCVSVLELLERHGADLNHAAADRWTPLHVATFRGKTAAVRKLLQLKVNVNCTTTAGHTPLMFAVNLGRVKEARCLLQSNATIELNDPRHDNLLHYALHHRLAQAIGIEYKLPDSQLDVAVLLVLNGVCPDEFNDEGHTPTRYAEETLPSLPKALNLLFSNAIKLLCAPTEMNYLTLAAATVEFFVEKVGLDTAQAQALVEVMATLEEERQAIRPKPPTNVDRIGGAAAPSVSQAVHTTLPPRELDEDGGGLRKGMCPFLERTAKHHTKDPACKGTDKRPRFFILYTLRHRRNTLLLIGTAFLFGYYCGQRRRV